MLPMGQEQHSCLFFSHLDEREGSVRNLSKNQCGYSILQQVS